MAQPRPNVIIYEDIMDEDENYESAPEEQEYIEELDSDYEPEEDPVDPYQTDDDEEDDPDNGYMFGDPGFEISDAALLQHLGEHDGGAMQLFLNLLQGGGGQLPNGMRFVVQPPEVVLQEPGPSHIGQGLMVGSDFGSEPASLPNDKNKKWRKSSQQEIFLQREMGAYTSRGQTKSYYQSVAKSYLPESNADFVIENDHHSYIGQFSDDGNFFYSASQDMRIQLYDTQDPLNWKHYKSVLYSGGQWTISDASLSPDNRLLAYASLSSTIFIADTTPGFGETRRFEFADRTAHSMRRNSGIMSVRFSGDGSELLVGAKDTCCYLYDLNVGRPVLRLEGHEDEVNAVCYGDKNSPHIIYSGSDDATIKIWDRRSISDGRPLGVFTGHLEGVTFVHSKGDGRYVLSNGKDQRMKLWDLRMMMDTAQFDNLHQDIKYPPATFDYRNERFRERGNVHHYDKSLVNYRGHKVYRTLIRCYFSPPQSTGSRYVYTGSADGVVRIFNIDSTLAGTIDVHSATEAVRKANEEYVNVQSWYRGYEHNSCCIRDVSWHPSAPVFAATGFQGNHIGVGSISVHSWKGAEKDYCAEKGREDRRARKYEPKIYGKQMQFPVTRGRFMPYSDVDDDDEEEEEDDFPPYN